MQSRGNPNLYGGNVLEFDGELPQSLPSYLPPDSSNTTGYMNYSNRPDLMEQSVKRQAPVGQWKTPPQFLYTTKTNSNTNKSTASIPCTSKRTDSFSPVAGFQAMSFQDGKRTTSNGQSETLKTNGISPEQFSASTGGLTLDTALLARMSGKDESEIGEEQIKSIMSCPDLLAIYQKLQEEDEKRRRRLARNRASARLRRQKKKSLVETYEAEVSSLEEILKTLKSHKWGSGNSEQLKKALGKVKQCPTLSKEIRHENVSSILQQHMTMINRIDQCQNEYSFLHLIGKNYENIESLELNSNEMELIQEVDNLLQLTHEQKELLAKKTMHTIQEEHRELAILNKCFAALRVHNWLYFPLTEGFIEQSSAMFNQVQMTKLTTWTSLNENSLNTLQIENLTTEGEKKEAKLAFVFPENM